MIRYRKAIIADIPTLVKLRVDFLKEVSHRDDYDTAIEKSLAQYFSRHIPAGDYINWLAIDGNDIIGTGGIYFFHIPPNFLNISGNRAYILNVYTVKAYRRRGVSKIIFERLMREAYERSISQISLHATSDGKTLYEQFGFKTTDNEMVWGNHL